MAPQVTGPTWRNGRIGDEGISKFLDRFLIFNSLLPSLGVYRTWTKCLELSDHFPICFEWSSPKGPFDYPFKFNRSWLDDTDFIEWFLCWWTSNSDADNLTGIEDLCLILRKLKSATKTWTKIKSASFASASSRLDLAIESILAGPTNGILTKEQSAHLSLLSAERQRRLKPFTAYLATKKQNQMGTPR